MGSHPCSRSGCAAFVERQRVLLNEPEIFTVCVGWDAKGNYTRQMLTDFFETIPTQLPINRIFSQTTQSDDVVLDLAGVVCYYGMHYSMAVRHAKNKKWMMLDDAIVRDVGPTWYAVKEQMIKSHQQPCMIVFVNKNSTPLDVSTAPKSVTWNQEQYELLKKRVEEEKRLEQTELEKETLNRAEMEERDRLYAQRLIEEEEKHYQEQKAQHEQQQQQQQQNFEAEQQLKRRNELQEEQERIMEQIQRDNERKYRHDNQSRHVAALPPAQQLYSPPPAYESCPPPPPPSLPHPTKVSSEPTVGQLIDVVNEIELAPPLRTSTQKQDMSHHTHTPIPISKSREKRKEERKPEKNQAKIDALFKEADVERERNKLKTQALKRTNDSKHYKLDHHPNINKPDGYRDPAPSTTKITRKPSVRRSSNSSVSSHERQKSSDKPLVKVDRLESHRHQNRPPTKPASVATTATSRDQFEHAHTTNPYSTTYNSEYSAPSSSSIVQSKPPTQPKHYNSHSYDEFDPIRPSSRSHQSHKHTATSSVVTEPHQKHKKDEFERDNMRRASARYRQKWKQPKSTDPKQDEPILFTSSSSEQIDQHNAVDYAPTVIIHNPAAAASSAAAIGASDLIDLSGNKTADTTGMHNLKKGIIPSKKKDLQSKTAAAPAPATNLQKQHN